MNAFDGLYPVISGFSHCLGNALLKSDPTYWFKKAGEKAIPCDFLKNSELFEHFYPAPA